MTLPLALCSAALILALAVPASAAPECLANGKSFQIGLTTCLTLPGGSYLARCDAVLNNSSWTKIVGACPGTAPDSATPVTPILTPAPAPIPAEPTEN